MAAIWEIIIATFALGQDFHFWSLDNISDKVNHFEPVILLTMSLGSPLLNCHIVYYVATWWEQECLIFRRVKVIIDLVEAWHTDLSSYHKDLNPTTLVPHLL